MVVGGASEGALRPRRGSRGPRPSSVSYTHLLGETEAAALPTDERIRRAAELDDPALAALFFQFGRYLLIASSRPGTQPANLQGIWNQELSPPWDSKWTCLLYTSRCV